MQMRDRCVCGGGGAEARMYTVVQLGSQSCVWRGTGGGGEAHMYGTVLPLRGGDCVRVPY
jgi:hypothetical protein